MYASWDVFLRETIHKYSIRISFSVILYYGDQDISFQLKETVNLKKRLGGKLSGVDAVDSCVTCGGPGYHRHRGLFQPLVLCQVNSKNFH
jgi:hypothetical protein